MESLVYTYTRKESGLTRLPVYLGKTLWGLLEDMGPTLSVREYSSRGISYLADESCLRIAPVKSILNFDLQGYLVTDLGIITDHLGIPFAPIRFFRFGYSLQEIVSSNYFITFGEGENELLVPITSRSMPLNKEIFKPLKKSFPIVFGDTLITALNPVEYNPLRDDGRYISPFKQS